MVTSSAAVRLRPAGVSAIGAFFVFGAAMSALAAFLLLYPGTALDALWRLNPPARVAFATMGPLAVFLMAMVSVTCATAAVGLWRTSRWGLWVAIGLLAANLIGDLANAVMRQDFRALIGLPIAGAMIAYLVSVRRVFRKVD